MRLLLHAVWLLVSAAWLTASLTACAFPIIEFEEQAPTRRLAYASTQQHSQPRAAAGRVVLAHSKASTESASKRARSSVMAPYVPEPEPAQHHVSATGPAPAPVPTLGACQRALSAAGVKFENLSRQDAPGVAWPIRLRGPVRGVTFEAADNDPTHSILDCRLGLALVTWAKDLRRAGVRHVEHYSMYRPGAHVAGTDTISGHAHGLAIDAARFTLDNGATIDVLDDWEGRRHGQAPCPVRRDEASASRLLRGVTCAAVDDQVFQVVLTPHYNKAHENHVHLEQKPDVDWTYVR